MDGVWLDPTIPHLDYACKSGVIIYTIVFFESRDALERGFVGIGDVYGAAMTAASVTEVAVALSDTGLWMAWVEKEHQPITAPPELVTIDLQFMADELGGTSYTISI